MKRTTAREIAVQLGFYACASEKPVDELLEEFFNKEYYDTLAEENELFAEYPEKKQREYISRLVKTVYDYRIHLEKRLFAEVKNGETDHAIATAETYFDLVAASSRCCLRHWSYGCPPDRHRTPLPAYMPDSG